MSCSMQDYLRIVSPHLHPNLVSPKALSHIQLLAQILPSLSVAGFECRLGANQSRVDFQVSLPCLTLNLPQQFLIHPVWQFFQNFCQEWTEPSSFLYKRVEKIHLEFDLDGEQSSIVLPCIFLRFNRENVNDIQTLIKMSQRLLGHGSHPLIESNLQRCTDSLPPEATISHLGAMLSRSANGVRVNIREISLEELPDYLIKIGWGDPKNEFSILISTLSQFVDSIILSIDVCDTVQPRIGLECFLNNQPHEEPRWKLFLDYLEEEKLCTLAKKNAFLAWSGLSRKLSTSDIWPNNISFGDRFFGSRAFSVFWRRVSHIKLIYQPDIPLEAKGYLAFGHSWYARNALIKTEPQKVENGNLTS